MLIFKNCKHFICPYQVYPYHRSNYSDTKFKFKNKRISGDDQIKYKRKAFQSLWEGLRKVKAFHPNFIANQKNLSFLAQYWDRQITATFILAITKLDRKISTASFYFNVNWTWWSHDLESFHILSITSGHQVIYTSIFEIPNGFLYCSGFKQCNKSLITTLLQFSDILLQYSDHIFQISYLEKQSSYLRYVLQKILLIFLYVTQITSP